MEPFDEVIAGVYMDLSACLLAIANVLEHKGIVTKRELAEGAQERLLTLQQQLPPGKAATLVLLASLATQFERLPNELPKDRPPRRS